MDGANSDQVSAANTTYVPSGQLGGDGASHPGVWCGLTITTLLIVLRAARRRGIIRWLQSILTAFPVASVA